MRFEHNEQSLRIVDLLESKYPHFPGLNLSYEVRQGIQKHKTPLMISQILLIIGCLCIFRSSDR